jgi:membrane protein DedA with SNARE-associated domain
MNSPYQKLKQILPFLILAAMAVTIVSLTIGKEIYGHQEENLVSFAVVNFSGYLFFLVMPVELAFIYYLKSGVDIYLLNGLAVSTALAAQLVDYYIGRFFSFHIIDRLIGRHSYEKAKTKIRKYGNIAIFVFNLLPLSSPVIMLAAGVLKHRLEEAVFYSVSGLLLKYMVIMIVF